MAYMIASLDDILNHNDSRNIVQLTNDDDTVDYTDTANINQTVLQAAENDAAYTVTNYLRYLYSDIDDDGTGDVPTEEIVGIVARMTKIKLYERRDYEPDTITAMRDRLMERLARMAKFTTEVREGKTVKTPSNR